MQKPDWNRWSSCKSALAWECLALSVDVEPRALSVDHFLVIRSSQSGMPLLRDADPDWLQRLCKRLNPLAKAVDNPAPGLRAGRGKAPGFDAELQLAAFVNWATSLKWTMPREIYAVRGAKLPPDTQKVTEEVTAKASPQGRAKKTATKAATKAVKASPKSAKASSKAPATQPSASKKARRK